MFHRFVHGYEPMIQLLDFCHCTAGHSVTRTILNILLRPHYCKLLITGFFITENRVKLRKTVVLITDYLCANLAAMLLFQAFIEANDGMVDGPFAITEEGLVMSSCFHLSLQVLAALFSWYVKLLLFASCIHV